MKCKKPEPSVLKVTQEQVEAMLQRAKALLSSEDYAIIKALVDKDAMLTDLLKQQGTRLNRLRRLFGIRGSEKSKDVLPPQDDSTVQGNSETKPENKDLKASASDRAQHPEGSSSANSSTAADNPSGTAESNPSETEKQKTEGHGRIPASAYSQAEHIKVEHETLKVKDRCPRCASGKLYRLKEPAPILHIVGNAPLVATCYDCERLRCNTCGHIFTAQPPKEAQGGKYDESAVAMLALLHYSMGMPFYRLAQLQSHLQTPVPESTQWDLLNEHVPLLQPVYDLLLHLAAQGDLLHSDDSYVRILEFMGKRRADLLAQGKLENPDRTGLFTTAIVSISAFGPIAIFFSGRNHSGENLDDILKDRADDLGPPISMTDALNRNVPKETPVIEANCMSHARRYIVDEVDNYPSECRFILEKLATVYALDDELRQLEASDELRLLAHRYFSGPTMDELKAYMTDLLEKKKIEPHCGLGKAFNYWLKRWDKLTLFLRVLGAPLDNNYAERVLKMPIKQRKSSMFYFSQNGARVAGIYMSLIHTAQLHGINPYDYLTALLKHPKDVADNPSNWLPWTYQDTLAQMTAQFAA